MTKEKLKDKVFGTFGPDDYRRPILTEVFNEFFSQNICIPRGENRHPSADVLHEWIEDITKTLQYKNIIDGNWTDRYVWHSNDEYRIKPAEPVYEYLWLDLRTPDDFYCPTNKYMTELEAEAYFRPSHTWFKVLETKRERK
jgi:hypothetical protein